MVEVIAASAERAPWGWALLASVILAMVKGWPILRRIRNERETTLLNSQAAEMEKMSRRIADLEAKVERASTTAHAAEMKLVYAVSAVQLLAAKIRADNPQDPTLKQAMELLTAATGGMMPGVGARLSEGLNAIQGSNE